MSPPDGLGKDHRDVNHLQGEEKGISITENRRGAQKGWRGSKGSLHSASKLVSHPTQLSDFYTQD